MTNIADLSHTLNHWIRRLRLQRAITWSLRGMAIGLGIALMAGVAGLSRLALLRGEFLVLTILSTVCTALTGFVIAYLWPVQPLQAARYFDRVFHLGERVSTALELQSNGQVGSLAGRQLEDALRVSQRIRPGQYLPFRIRQMDFMYVLVGLSLIATLWLRGEGWFKAAAQARAVQVAVEQQVVAIEELIEEIEANQVLSDDQQEQLMAPLEQALNALQENPTLEGSVSILTSSAEKLEGLSNEQVEGMSEALQQAGSELASQPGSPMQSAGENLAQGNNQAAASEMANLNVSEMSDAEKQQLADQANTLGDAVSSTNPQLANELQKAEDALQNGDDAAAQQALNNAAQMMVQAGQEVTFSQTANQASQQMQQGANQVLASGGGGSQAQTGGPGQQPGAGTGQHGGTSGTGTSGSGSGSESGSPTAGNEAGNTPIDQNNGPGDGGEAAYEQIYAPSLLGGEDGSTVDLPTSGEDGEVIGQGPTDPSQPGQSLVPYNEVYAQYDQFNREAIESGTIPLSFMDIIRNYFDSLEP
jgi:hypothetical protein